MYQRFKRLDRDQSGTLSASELMAIPEFAMNPLGSTRLVPLFLDKVNDDADDSLWLDESVQRSGLSFRGFIKILSVFHPKASLKEKLQCNSCP